MTSFLAFLQIFVAFPSGCSSMLARLRKFVLTVGHGKLPYSSLETTNAMGLPSALHGC